MSEAWRKRAMNEHDSLKVSPDPSPNPSKRAERIQRECNRYRKQAMQLPSFKDKVRVLRLVNKIEKDLLEAEAK